MKENTLGKDRIKNIINQLGYKYTNRKVFEDFVLISTYSIQNSIIKDENIEDKYNKIVQKYTDEEVSQFAKMLAILIEEYKFNDCKDDILGSVFEELNISNSKRGQFFTPMNVSNMMAALTYKKEEVENAIQKKDYLTVQDPACGSGRMLYSTFFYLKNMDVDVSDKVYFEGADIDELCCGMTYIQLSILGASAVIYHKDSLSNEEYNKFVTPKFLLNNDMINYLTKKGDDYGLE